MSEPRNGLRGLDELVALLPRCGTREDVFHAVLRVVEHHFSVARSLLFLVPGPSGSFELERGWAGARELPSKLEVSRGGPMGLALQMGQSLLDSRPLRGGACLLDWERSALMAPAPGLALYLGAPGPGAFDDDDRGYAEVLAYLAASKLEQLAANSG